MVKATSPKKEGYFELRKLGVSKNEAKERLDIPRSTTTVYESLFKSSEPKDRDSLSQSVIPDSTESPIQATIKERASRMVIIESEKDDQNKWTIALYTGVCIGVVILACLIMIGLYKFYRWWNPTSNESTNTWEDKIAKIVGDMEENLNQTIKSITDECQETIRQMEEKSKQREEEQKMKYEEESRKREEEMRASLKKKYEEALRFGLAKSSDAEHHLRKCMDNKFSIDKDDK